MGRASVVMARECSGSYWADGHRTAGRFGPDASATIRPMSRPARPSHERRPLRVGGPRARGPSVARSIAALLDRPDELRAGRWRGPRAGRGRRPRRRAGPSRAGPAAELVSDAPAHLVADDRIDVIVELMGGDEPAHTLIAAALAMGKSVVTANKHVIAHHGPELEAIARRTGAALRFEAAVGGGIPVLGPLAGDLAANRVERVRGIVNGTTNFILTRDDRRDGAARLRGGAGRGPAAGLRRGGPVGRRRGLRRGQQAGHPGPARVRPLAGSRRRSRPGPTGSTGRRGPGITTVSLADQEDARAAGRIIRLVATARAGDEDERLDRGGAADRAPARLGARPDGRRAQPDRGRRRRRSAASASTARAPAARRRRRPSSATSSRSPASGLDLGPAAGRRPVAAGDPSRGPTGDVLTTRQRHPVPDR